ncbi:uncharacterized protein EAF01_009227 [Botrytis porri]|uniref:Uncharacterized protein n=1 Tax=Botrytis porri TaxID=87229 RepID=A0A4Z1L1R4_9HELO|nr:uncharacterized protein EAF01_009227 [Botrytis porri]KAF7896824.1 hypothetical protein EAF01_009227 [Botrytis porri]TGO90759.1 hypothetical protein BPOR_0052g00220 [Botrytis porri]
MSGLMPSNDENEYGNIIRRAPFKYPSRLMNRSPSPEPRPAMDHNYHKPLDVNDYPSRFSLESEERERLEEIEYTKRVEKERVEENKAANRKLQADSDYKAVTKRVTKVLRKTSIFEPKYEAETGEGSSKGSGKGIGRGIAKK